MSAATVFTQGWIDADQLRAEGFVPTGPERDYGMRWGETHAIRVSWAPREDAGFLYAHNRETDKYLLLADRTTPEQVDGAWRELLRLDGLPDAYLAFAGLQQPIEPLPVSEATQLLRHCVEREMNAYRTFADAPSDEPVRMNASVGVVVARAARVAAEQLQIEAIHEAAVDQEPVIIRYWINGRTEWSGRIAGESLSAATCEARYLQQAAERYGLAVQATSVSRGHSVIAAPRVPELAFIAPRAQIPSNAPGIEL